MCYLDMIFEVLFTKLDKEHTNYIKMRVGFKKMVNLSIHLFCQNSLLKSPELLGH